MLPVATGGGFWMDETEVTAAQFRGCVDAGACTAPNPYKPSDKYDRFCNWGRSGRDNHPINCVDWYQSEAFCAWADKRLPTNEQWEYAATGGDGRIYPWGNTDPSDQLCWKRWYSKQGTCEVGAYPSGQSPFGLMDMAGNVFEWTADLGGTEYFNRGGGWFLDKPSYVRPAPRMVAAPSARESYVGFRCTRFD